ncbi:MAG: hypothetical protein LC118_12435 [Dehalococcoidia bacterium]|nr:hypothetical protein [Dehalococcoidia bacterium]
MKVWELHNLRLEGEIRTTPDGAAEIGGLVLSEKAYLIAVRDFRPDQLIELVARHGPHQAAEALVTHYSSPDARAQSGGRGLIAIRDPNGGPGVYRSDELGEGELMGRRL